MTTTARPTRLAALSVVVLLLTVLTTARSEAAGNTYYVSTSGSDTSLNTCAGGTESSPWATIEFGMRCLQPGDTLIVRGGTYQQEVTPVTTSGTAAQPILVTAAPGERVVIEGILWLRSDGNISGFDHWTIRGLNVTFGSGISDGFAWLVKFVGGKNWAYEDAEVWNAGPPSNYAAVRVEDLNDGPAGEPANWALRRLCVHSTRAAHPPYQDHNIYIDTGLDAGPGVIERSIVFGAPNGKNLKIGPEAANLTIRYNTLYDASENVLVDSDSKNILLERNLLGRVTGKEWYPHLRGFAMSGTNVVARDNVGFEPAPNPRAFIYNDTNGSTGIIDGGGNRSPLPVTLNSTASCAGFRVTSTAGAAFGRYADTERVAGSSRVATGAALSKRGFPSASAVDAVLLARSDAYPDALAGAPLAAQVGGPVLLTSSNALSPEAKAEIQRLDPSKAYLLGGDAALSPAIESELKSMGVEPVRIEGSNRFATAAAVAPELPATSHAFIVEGADASPTRGWPDAVAVSALAARVGSPILLVTTESLPDATRQALIDLGITSATVVGGEAAVSQEVADAVADPDGDGDVDIAVERIAGASRYDTAVKVAQRAMDDGADPATTWMASGGNWPDALAAGPIVAQTGGVFLFVHPTDLTSSAPARDFLASKAGSIVTPIVVGGQAAVSFGVEDQVAATLG